MDSYEPWSFKRRRKYLEIAFEFILTCGDASQNEGFGFAEYADADSVPRALRVLGGEGSGDGKKDKGVVLPALEEGFTVN
ncbi:unnamed protein product [Rhizophagus irregularis]|nr:unnamed protein product [Rhizophagus irregularis]